MEAGLDELEALVLARLREGIGKAWQDPVRVHVDVRAKRRAEERFDFAARVEVTFPTGVKVVVVEGFGTGPESWVIKVGG